MPETKARRILHIVGIITNDILPLIGLPGAAVAIGQMAFTSVDEIKHVVEGIQTNGAYLGDHTAAEVAAKLDAADAAWGGVQTEARTAPEAPSQR